MRNYTIGKIVFDDILCVSLKKEVFIKLPLIKKYVYSDNNFEMLLKSLTTIQGMPEERILDFISLTNDAIVKQFGQRITQETETVYYSSVLWEWFYLLAYYVHQLDQDPQWLENYLPHTKGFQIRNICIEETKKGEALIDQFIAKRKRVLETQQNLQQPRASKEESLKESKAIEEYISQNTILKDRINELEKENATLKARVAELESQIKQPYLSFIQTEGKHPDAINGVYREIQKNTVGPAEMAECLHDLQVQGMLKNQERYGKLKKIKKIHEELQKTYGFEWSYDALRRALSRKTTKK